MRDTAVVLLGIVLLGSVVSAQSRPATVSDNSTGVVTGTDVYVRSGPATTAYPCTKLNHPATVTVVKTGEWVEILPPPGVFSVVKKEYVTKDPDGSGTINADAVYVRAGGDLRTRDFEIHGKLNKGDKVKILGDLGDFVKIEPPPGVHFYISSRFVSVGGTLLAGGEPATRPTGGGLADGTVRVVREPATRAVPAVSTTYYKELQSLEAVEKSLADEWTKPAEQRDIKGMQDQYKALELTDSELKGVQEGRVKWLQSILDRKAANLAAEEIINQARRNQAEIDRKIASIVAQANIKPDVPVHYDAQGVLGTSNLFTGNAAGPKRFVLRDPITQRVDAYMQCTTGAVTLEDFVGKHVGVMGKPQYDKSMMLNVVEVDKVVPLPGAGQIPEPPKPSVKDTTTAPAAPATPPPPAVEPKVEPKAAPTAALKVEPAVAPKAEPAAAAAVHSTEPPAVETIKVQPVDKAAPVKVDPTNDMDLSESAAAARYVARAATAPTVATKPVIEESRD